MGKATYHNRYRHINMVVGAMGQFGDETPTEISKRVNLSRQAILDILKHAETWGYVYSKPYQYRSNVIAHKWYPTDYGLRNANWYLKAVSDAKAKGGQLPLL